MDNVYEVFTTPRETTGLQGIHFRFMPDMQQVKHALQVRQRCVSMVVLWRSALLPHAWVSAICYRCRRTCASAQLCAGRSHYLGTQHSSWWHDAVECLTCLSTLQLYKDAGVPTKNFIGVPVFQAEGLTVTTQDMVSRC
jgi:hypothetical protein